jgi:hypothetical protein
MSAFEDFVQTEIPKRPYLSTDVTEETVMIRRGAGPRQLAAITLGEKQVVALVNGVLVGTTVAQLGNGVRKAILSVPLLSAADQWDINHGFNSTNAIIQVVDQDGFVITPDLIQIVSANSIQILFNSVQAGTARVIFLD